MNQSQRSRQIRWVLGKVQKKIGKRRFPCLYPGCDKPAIRSHSQQKEGQLRIIAKGGYVYSLGRNLVESVKRLTTERSPFIRVGIGEASAFQGYCANHDNDIFAAIEKKPLSPNDPEQASLLFLRAISMEYAAKRKGVIQREMLADAIGNAVDSQWQEHNATLTKGMKLFLEREGPFYLGRILDIISSKDYGDLHIAWVRVPQTLPISVTTSVCPWLDDYYNKWSLTQPQAMVSFSVIPSESHTDVISSWLDYCHNDAEWIQKEMATLEGTQRVVNLLGIAESEDFCIEIDFWESLSNDSQELVLSNMRHDIFRGQLTRVPLIIKLEKTEPVNSADPKGRAAD
jgi:hypothetical protein